MRNLAGWLAVGIPSARNNQYSPSYSQQMRVFHPPRAALDLALERLKSDGVVHPDARLNLDAESGLRKEVAFRDYELQYRLARSPQQAAIVESARQLLVSIGVISADAGYSETSTFSHFFIALSPSLETNPP